MKSCAYRAFLETVNSESAVCGPSKDYPGDEHLVQLKECTRDVRAKTTRRSSISVSFL